MWVVAGFDDNNFGVAEIGHFELALVTDSNMSWLHIWENVSCLNTEEAFLNYIRDRGRPIFCQEEAIVGWSHRQKYDIDPSR